MTDRKPRPLWPLVTAVLIGLPGCSGAARDVEDARNEAKRLGRDAESTFETTTDAEKRLAAISRRLIEIQIDWEKASPDG